MTVIHAGRLAKSTQQAVLLDGRQLGTLCHLAALRLPPKGASKAAPDDAARQLFFQVNSHPVKIGRHVFMQLFLCALPTKMIDVQRSQKAQSLHRALTSECRMAGAPLTAWCSCARQRGRTWVECSRRDASFCCTTSPAHQTHPRCAA